MWFKNATSILFCWKLNWGQIYYCWSTLKLINKRHYICLSYLPLLDILSFRHTSLHEYISRCAQNQHSFGDLISGTITHQNDCFHKLVVSTLKTISGFQYNGFWSLVFLEGKLDIFGMLEKYLLYICLCSNFNQLI